MLRLVTNAIYTDVIVTKSFKKKKLCLDKSILSQVRSRMNGCFILIVCGRMMNVRMNKTLKERKEKWRIEVYAVRMCNLKFNKRI